MRGGSFSVTGWKLGWAVGPAHLIHPLQTAHQNSTLDIPTPIQEAVAMVLEREINRFSHKDSYFQSLAEELLPKRDFMAKFLSEVGMKPVVPEGGYFMLADYSSLMYVSALSKMIKL